MSAVVFTCAGQRVDIVSAFKRAGAETIAADVNPLAPALYAADRFVLAPRIEPSPSMESSSSSRSPTST